MYPELLIIVLCREIGIAEVNENNINTVNTAVEFPLEGFATVSNVQEQSTVVDYNLIGTVNYKAKIKGVITQLSPRMLIIGTVMMIIWFLSSLSGLG